MKKSTIWALVVALLLVFAIIYFASDRDDADNTNPVGQSNTQTPVDQTDTNNTDNNLHGGLTYSEALAKYSNRAQVNSCEITVSSGIPGTMIVKKAASFMIDNRDNQVRTIAFGGQSHKLAATDFAIVAANTIGTFKMTCDGTEAATLVVTE
jgi:hypothetical protein